MPEVDFEKQIRDICDDVKWARKYSRHDINMIDQLVIKGHENESILNLSLYAYGRIHAVHSASDRKIAEKSQHLLKHLKHEQPEYPRGAAIFALERLKAVERHWEFLVEECEREKAYYLSTANDDGHYNQFYDCLEDSIVEDMIREDVEKLINHSDLVRLVEKYRRKKELIAEIRDAWGWTGIRPVEVLAENDFGNLLIEDEGGKFWRLCPEDVYCKIVTKNRKRLNALFKDKNFLRDWEMSNLVDAAKAGVGPLEHSQKYCLVIPGVLGGAYDVSNIKIVTLTELVRFSGDVGEQIRDLPDGARIELKVVD